MCKLMIIIHFIMVVLSSSMVAVSRVSAEWVNESFTSLRVSLPGESTYRITYTSVNESNATEPKTVTTNLISHVVEDFRPDWFYAFLVETVSLDSDEAINESIGIGEQYHVMLYTWFSSNFYSCGAGIGIAVAVAVTVAIMIILLGLCCC